MPKFDDVGKGYYCEMKLYGLKECPCTGRNNCVGCKTGRRRNFKFGGKSKPYVPLSDKKIEG